MFALAPTVEEVVHDGAGARREGTRVDREGDRGGAAHLGDRLHAKLGCTCHQPSTSRSMRHAVKDVHREGEGEGERDMERERGKERDEERER